MDTKVRCRYQTLRHMVVSLVQRFHCLCDVAVCFLCQLRGMYAARQLSFAGVNFSIKDVPLSEKFVEMYDASVELVSLLPSFLLPSSSFLLPPSSFLFN